ANYGPQEGAREVPWAESTGFGSLTNVLTNGDNPACHGFQCQLRKGDLFTKPLLDNLSSFLARNCRAESAMRGTACPVGDYAEKVFLTVWRTTGIGKALVLADFAIFTM